MDKYRIDSHKLMYHVGRVNKWLNGDNVYPIYMEVSPIGACNHRCTFCGLDFMGYQARFLDSAVLGERLREMGKLGLKSIMYAGEGEPLLHKSMPDIVKDTYASGIDVAMTTNAVLLNKSISERILGYMEWIKVSVNAGTAETYSRIHRTKNDDFDVVIKNIENAVSIKGKQNYKCTIGMQMLLLPENRSEVLKLAIIARDIGADYIVVKPYSQHLQSRTTRYNDIKYSEHSHMADELNDICTEDFKVIFRSQSMIKWDNDCRNYSRCYSLPFWSYIDAGGNVWGCSVYLEDGRFLYGNIYESTFKKIWESSKRKASLRFVEEDMDVSGCRVNCRMDEINRYLWDLRNQPEHLNFI